MEVWPGTAYPLGATFDGVGTNFAIFSEVAEQVELCLFDDARNEVRVPLNKRTDRLSDIIVKVDPDNATAVEWEEKKEKK